MLNTIISFREIFLNLQFPGSESMTQVLEFGKCRIPYQYPYCQVDFDPEC